MKVIKYNFGGLPASMAYSDTNLAIAKKEADDGDYAIVEENDPFELTRDLTTDELLQLVLAPMLESVPDATASRMVQHFPALNESGELVKAGARINWYGQLVRAAVDLWDTAENNPDNAPTLWEALPYRNGIRVIPDVITAGTAFSEGEYGWWGESIYKSRQNANVYNPEQHADGWDIMKP